jgi:hypothetical protein
MDAAEGSRSQMDRGGCEPFGQVSIVSEDLGRLCRHGICLFSNLMLSYSLSSSYNHTLTQRMHCIISWVETSVSNSPHHVPYHTGVLRILRS